MSINKTIKILYPFGYPNEKIYFLYSLGNYFYKKRFIRTSIFFEYLILRKFGCAISSQSILHSSIIFPHPVGIVIGAGVIVEENVIIYQNVTIGRRESSNSAYPTIKKNSIIYANSVLVGNGIIGENTIVGANTVINGSTESFSTYVGTKARRIK